MSCEERPQAKFSLGRLVATPGALEAVPHEDRIEALTRHVTGDWGEVPAEDAAENELSLVHGFRIVSAFTSKSGVKFWIITEADRSSTCILLPEEY